MNSPNLDTNSTLTQYRECIKSFHHLERTSWQLPSLAIVLLNIMGAVAWGVLGAGLPRVLLLVMGGIMMLAFAMAAQRFTLCMSPQVGIVARIRRLEESMGLDFIYGNYERLYGVKRGASDYMTYALYIFAAGMFIQAIFALVEAL